MKIAYLVNHYPKVSHTFIRREILALERQGFEVTRLAVRGWDDAVPDADDQAEQARTRYLLRRGAAELAPAMLAMLVSAPGRFLAALGLALRMGRRADRPLPLHLVYFAEACLAHRWLARLQVRHLHAHFGTNSAEVAMLVTALGGPPYSFTVHGPDEFDKPEFLHLGEKIRRSRFVVAITSFCRSQLYRWVDAAHWDKVKVVHCGLERAFHEASEPPPASGNRLVCVGRLSEQKGHLLLIEAAKRLADAGIAFELVLAGDGELRPQIEARIAQLQLQQHIRITGWISSNQVREEIIGSRALVLASFAEGLPVVVMEAFALRRPVVSTRIAGIPELVEQGNNGWLVPPGDVSALAEAMQTCLQCSLDQVAAMGDAAFRAVRREHDIDTEAAKLAQLFMASPRHA
ncbi:colanic acid biosynthesis glycosyltransferase WcaL [Pseudorhodoferax aquiterrae]|uniref:Colanic acid biosynthesis glycosyltransferase WcaL n=1 Tax=Pseudorhodoferax aquiterrae TaxID=747304 RepID=A0ABQ3G1F1_9BURK|nr:glycosyltransferase [Pseudorhodoferax aquiterrae]GHC79682.1 colanic acid biosynthesis glycosyltransferase WcaL [Pseudorhodoferax aquiterrae]